MARNTWLAAALGCALALGGTVVLGGGTVALGAGVGSAKHSLGVTIAGARGRVSKRKPVKLTSRLSWRGPKDAKLSYAWESVAGPSLPYSIDRNSKDLTIDSEDLSEGAYHLRLRVRADWTDPEMDPAEQSVQAHSDVKFTVNGAPFGGACDVKHKWIGPHMVRVSIHARGWKDDADKRLQYRYSVRKRGKTSVLQNWRAQARHNATFSLKAGERAQLVCEVRDRLGDSSAAESAEIVRHSVHRKP